MAWQPYQHDITRYQQDAKALQHARKAYRANNERHIVEVDIKCDEEARRYILKMFNKLYATSNKLAWKIKNKLANLQQNHKYKHHKKEYGAVLEKIKREKNEEKLEQLENERKSVARKLNRLVREYGLDEESLVSAYRNLAETYEIPTDFAESRARDIYKGVAKVIYEGAREIHYLDAGNYPPLQGRQYNRTLGISIDGDGKLSLSLFHRREKKNTAPSKKKPSRHILLIVEDEEDAWKASELARVRKWLSDPIGNNLRDLLISVLNDNCQMDTGRVCYTSLVYKNGKIKAQIMIEGVPIPKTGKTGEPRHARATSGRAGGDLGTQSLAITSEGESLLVNIGEGDGTGYDMRARREEIKRVERAMDRSRRATNPENYNEDGTIKPKSERKPWVKSKRYKRLQDKRRKLLAGDAESRRNANRAIANKVRGVASELFIEPSNASALARKAKKDSDEPNKKRRRYGRSVASRAPGQLCAELERKFGDGFHVVDERAIAASQHDPSSGERVKHDLSERWFYLACGALVQRDLFAAFIQEHCDNDLSSVDDESCLRDLLRFLEHQDEVVRSMMKTGAFVKNSGVSERGIKVGSEWVSFDDFFEGAWRDDARAWLVLHVNYRCAMIALSSSDGRGCVEYPVLVSLPHRGGQEASQA